MLGTLALGWRRDRIDLASLVGLGLVGVFGIMVFMSRRFVEYFPLFALIFLALSSAPLVTSWRAEAAHRRPAHRLAFASAAALALVLLVAWSIRDARALVADSKPADLYAEAMLWLRAEAPDGVTVFQTDWDDFTRQFFYFDDARYINGLDPTFMQLYNENLYDEWVDITRGRADEPGQIIRDRFSARYVFSDLNHEAFLEEAADDPLLEEVYRDDYAVVFAVK